MNSTPKKTKTADDVPAICFSSKLMILINFASL